MIIRPSVYNNIRTLPASLPMPEEQPAGSADPRDRVSLSREPLISDRDRKAVKMVLCGYALAIPSGMILGAHLGGLQGALLGGLGGLSLVSLISQLDS